MRHHTLVGTSTRLQIKSHDLERGFGDAMWMHGDTTAQNFLNLASSLDALFLEILKETLTK